MTIKAELVTAGRKHPCSNCQAPISKGDMLLRILVLYGQEKRGSRSLCYGCLQVYTEKITKAKQKEEYDNFPANSN